MIKGRLRARALLALALLTWANWTLASNDHYRRRYVARLGPPQIRMDAGAPEERKRNGDAHHHKGHFKRDFLHGMTRWMSRLSNPATLPGNPAERQVIRQSIPWPAAIDLTVY